MVLVIIFQRFLNLRVLMPVGIPLKGKASSTPNLQEALCLLCIAGRLMGWIKLLFIIQLWINTIDLLYLLHRAIFCSSVLYLWVVLWVVTTVHIHSVWCSTSLTLMLSGWQFYCKTSTEKMYLHIFGSQTGHIMLGCKIITWHSLLSKFRIIWPVPMALTLHLLVICMTARTEADLQFQKLLKLTALKT